MSNLSYLGLSSDSNADCLRNLLCDQVASVEHVEDGGFADSGVAYEHHDVLSRAFDEVLG